MSEFVLPEGDVFGRYCKIAYGFPRNGKQDYHRYKCIQRFKSNTWCEVPLTYQTENNPKNHQEMTDVMNVIHCGIDETKVLRVAIKDVEFI